MKLDKSPSTDRTLDSTPQENILISGAAGLGFATVATTATALLVSGLVYLTDTMGFNFHRISDILLQRGVIPYIEVFFFWLSIFLLARKINVRSRERLSYKQICHVWSEIRKKIFGSYSTISSDKAKVLFEEIKTLKPVLVKSQTGRRLYHAVRRFFKTKRSKDVDTVLNHLSEMDSLAIETSYSNLRYIVWLIPTLGFIGTVIGIGSAIAGFGVVIQEGSNFDAVKDQIPQVTRDLGLAFDTTLLALFLTSIILAILSYTQKRDEDLLYRIDAFCVDEISGSFEDTDDYYSRLGFLFQDQTNQLNTTMKDLHLEKVTSMNEEKLNELIAALKQLAQAQKEHSEH